MLKKRIVILTGAGISAESGLKTFRDTDGLWEGHRVEDVATPEAFHRNPRQVLDFYNQRRYQLINALPNAAHQALVQFESKFEVHIITQNVDDLHERAGSKNIIHLHGELFKARSTQYPDDIYEWRRDLNLGDLCIHGYQLRPHIVWFGEQVPLLEYAIEACRDADFCIIIGTSMQVYPAAGLVRYLKANCKIYYIDPKPHYNQELSFNQSVIVLQTTATEGVRKLVAELMD